LVWAAHRLRLVGSPFKNAWPRSPCTGTQSPNKGFHFKEGVHGWGCNINLIYADTLRKINIPLIDLLPSENSFHDIVLGKLIYPLGLINLDVIFGTPTNFRKEKIEFEVVD
jgi:hypothetical protein